MTIDILANKNTGKLPNISARSHQNAYLHINTFTTNQELEISDSESPLTNQDKQREL